MDNANKILEIKNLCKDFMIKGQKIDGENAVLHALSDVDLDIYEGEVLGVIGESGCGKSTLGRTIVGLNKPTCGDILYNGKSIIDIHGVEKRNLCRDIQMIFQDPFSSLDPRHTAENSVAEPLVVHKIAKNKKEIRARVLELFQHVGLDEHHMSRYPHEFSGGQRQRLNVARAMAINPKLVVCDEPVSALDVSIQSQVINLLKRLQNEYNLTYLFISHDLSVVKYISDRIAIMYLGRVVELCTADAIYENPLHPYTKALLSAIPPEKPNEVKERIVLVGEVPSPIGKQVGCSLANRCPYVMDRCRIETPLLKAFGEDNHSVACFLYNE